MIIQEIELQPPRERKMKRFKNILSIPAVVIEKEIELLVMDTISRTDLAGFVSPITLDI